MSNISECMGLLLFFDDKRLATYKAAVVGQRQTTCEEPIESNSAQRNCNRTTHKVHEKEE
jgi:hypothetical protein